jgi:hypothetical protein
MLMLNRVRNMAVSSSDLNRLDANAARPARVKRCASAP